MRYVSNASYTQAFSTSKLFLALAIALVILWSPVAALAAQSPAQQYLHLRNSIASAVLPESRLAAVQSDPNSYYGQVVEASGKIIGGATTGDSRLIILQIGNISADVSVPPGISNSSPWLDTGNVVRVLVQAPPKSDTSNTLRLIAAAPEADVSQLERQLAVSSNNARPRAAIYSKRYGRASYESGRGLVYDLPSRLPVGHPTEPLSAEALRVYPAYRYRIARLNPRLSDQQVDVFTSEILYDSTACHIDPRLIIAMIIAESDFDPDSTSRTGAMGLGQLMPETAAGMGVTNAYDPRQNIAAAVQILSGNVNKYGGSRDGVVPLNTLLLTMAAYNAGSGAVSKYHGIPPYRETQRYVRRVAELYHALAPDAVVADQ